VDTFKQRRENPFVCPVCVSIASFPPLVYAKHKQHLTFISFFFFFPQRVLFNLKMERLLVKVAPPDGCNQKMVPWPTMVVIFAQRVNIPTK
jgi:hypothetical protein